jgi:hypothetical protein
MYTMLMLRTAPVMAVWAIVSIALLEIVFVPNAPLLTEMEQLGAIGIAGAAGGLVAVVFSAVVNPSTVEWPMRRRKR